MLRSVVLETHWHTLIHQDHMFPFISTSNWLHLLSSHLIEEAWVGGTEAILGEFTPLQQRFANVDDCVFPV